MEKSILTPREQEVFDLLALSKTTNDVASFLGVSPKTVRNHVSNVIQKLGVETRTQAMLELIKLGFIKF